MKLFIILVLAITVVGAYAVGYFPIVTATGVEHDYDEDKYDNFEESDLNPDNDNYVGDERIRELGGTPLSQDNGNGENNDDDSDNTPNTSLSNNGDIVGTFQNISEPVNVLSHNAREDGGYLHVVGEVENGLSRSIDFVKVTGTFYDATNSVIGTDFTFTDPNTLEAGETAPFDLTLFTDAVNPGEVASYKIRVSWQ
jgi:hypothetical protein